VNGRLGLRLSSRGSGGGDVSSMRRARMRMIMLNGVEDEVGDLGTGAWLASAADY
jgi:hypothetical protein